MGSSRFPWMVLATWVFLFIHFKHCADGSEASVKFSKSPLSLSSLTSAAFAFEISVGGSGEACKNCSVKCKLDVLAFTECEARQVSYTSLSDGQHTFEVCVDGLQGIHCESYNWTVDTIHPTAYVTADRSFTNGWNVSVDISFSEPCTGGGGFVCSSVNPCNLLVYGAGQVIPSSLKILQSGLKYSLLVGLSPAVQYGRVVLVMDRGFCTDAAGNRFIRTANSSFLLHFGSGPLSVDFGRRLAVQKQPPDQELMLFHQEEHDDTSYILTPEGMVEDHVAPLMSALQDYPTDISKVVFTDRRNVHVNLRTHVPEQLIQLNSQTRTVEATSNDKYLNVYLYFSHPVLNSSAEILSVLHISNGILLPASGRSHGNRRFGYIVENVSRIAIVTVSLETASIISRQGTPVSPTEPVTFLYDSQRPSVRLSTTSTRRTKERSVPVLIKFVKPVFGFNASAISISGGHVESFHEVSRSIYTADICANGSYIYVNVPENVTGDVAGNGNLASNLLKVRHYSVPTVSSVLSAVTTAAFGVTSLAAGLITVSTASLQSVGVLHRQSSLLTSDRSRNLIRIACHIQVFALSKWLVVTLPVEYYEFVRSLQWIIPRLNLPWESERVHSIMADSTSPFVSQSGKSRKYVSGTGKGEIHAPLFGMPLTPMEYKSFFESPDMKPEAEYIRDSQNSNGWKDFNRNMFWLAVIGGGLILLHVLLCSILKFKRKDSKKAKNYGALIFPRFELFLIILALPCVCQASAAAIRGGSTAGIIVGVLLLGIASFLLLSLLSFLSIGITMGKLLQYKEVHQEGQKFHWYQDLVRVSLGPGKRGQWTWKNQPNSPYLTMLGPLFEDLRGPPKYMLSQIAGGNPGNRADRIIASDDETEDAEAPFIQKLFGILRIYYTLLASVKRAALGIVAGAYLANSSSKLPTMIMLSITSFELFFLVLKKPFIKKRVQFVEIVSIASQVGIFAICLFLLEKELSEAGENKFGIIMLLLFMIGFLAQMINEWHALYKQIIRLGSVENSFVSGLKAALIGFLLILIPEKLLKNWEEEFLPKTGDGGTGSSNRNGSSGSTSSGDRPWMKQLRELAKASFSRDEEGAVKDPSTSEKRSGFWTGKRSGSSTVTSSADLKTRPRGLYRDLESIFSSK